MEKIYKLSKNGCGECTKLDFLLRSSKFKDISKNIVVVNKEDQEKEYDRLISIAKEFGASSLPVLMTEDKVLAFGFNPTKINTVFQEEGYFD